MMFVQRFSVLFLVSAFAILAEAQSKCPFYIILYKPK